MYNDDLYTYAEKRHIAIDTMKIKSKKSFSCTYGGRDFIAIDEQAMESSAEERTHLAHELGHCETGAFYDVDAPEQVRSKAESQATRWAVKKLIPKKEFEVLLKKGLQRWELAEHYNVTEDFIQQAYHLYYECGMAS